MCVTISTDELKRIHDDVLAGRTTLEEEARRHGKSVHRLKDRMHYHGYGIGGRKMQRLISDEQIEEAYHRRMAGETYKDIAADYYVSDATLASYVHNACTQHGWPMPNDRHAKLAPELVRRVNEEYQAGLKSVAQICSEYGISGTSVCRCVEMMGGKRRIPAIQRKSSISDETARQMMEEYRRPEVKLATLSAKYGVDASTIRDRIKDMPGYREAARLKRSYSGYQKQDYTHRRMYSDPLTDEQRAELLRMYLQPGMSLEKLTAKTGISGFSLQKIFAGNEEYKRTAALRSNNRKMEKRQKYGVQKATDG